MVENHTPKFGEIEAQVIDFFIEYGLSRGQSSKIAAISGYLSIYRSLTQQRLHELSKISVGSISTNLNAMLSMGMVEKKLIKGKRKKITSYSLSSPIFNVERGISLSLEHALNFIEFLKIKEMDLAIYRENKNVETLIENIKEMKQYLQNFGDILDRHLELTLK